MAEGNSLKEMLDHERRPAAVHAERAKAEGVWQLKVGSAGCKHS